MNCSQSRWHGSDRAVYCLYMGGWIDGWARKPFEGLLTTFTKGMGIKVYVLMLNILLPYVFVDALLLRKI